MTISTVRLTECPNCGAVLEGAFCAQCGQKAAPLNPSFGEVRLKPDATYRPRSG